MRELDHRGNVYHISMTGGVAVMEASDIYF